MVRVWTSTGAVVAELLAAEVSNQPGKCQLNVKTRKETIKWSVIDREEKGKTMVELAVNLTRVGELGVFTINQRIVLVNAQITLNGNPGKFTIGNLSSTEAITAVEMHSRYFTIYAVEVESECSYICMKYIGNQSDNDREGLTIIFYELAKKE